MSTPLGTSERPVRIAVIGAGPAAFYAVEAWQKQKDLHARIDMFNRFPTPFGLVREGVAPDHQSIKAVTRIYEKLADHPHFRYFGNVTFGTDVLLADLKPRYDQIIYAVGAQSDRRMEIPGEDLIGSFPATIFVGWYNGHPKYADLQFDLSCERVLVVGNGNVAMDVTRILVSDPEELAKTDMADHAIAALRNSQVREVVMLGRRGPAQAAFTNAELKEFGELPGVDVIVDPAELELDAQSADSLADNKIASRNVDMLRAYAARVEQSQPRRIRMRFLVSPVEVIGDAEGHVAAVRIEKNTLAPDSKGVMRPQGSGEFETLSCGMILRSVGYKGVPLPDVPFDERSATIPNASGRVLAAAGGAVVSGEYVVGWIKRGPSGVIGTNKPDSIETVKMMIEDLPNLPAAPDASDIAEVLAARKPEMVSYADWRTLDRYETQQGSAQGRPRVKVTSVDAMLDVIRKG